MKPQRAEIDGRRILVCDDERHILRLMQTSLSRQGHEVICAEDGAEAIHALEISISEGRPFQNAIIDMMMPRVDGYELLKWIRTHSETENPWVALLIAKDSDREVFEGNAYQADKYVVKTSGPHKNGDWL